MKDTGRDHVKDGFLSVHPDRVARIVASLVSHNEIAFFREKIGDFTFPLVTPLSTNDGQCLHVTFPSD